jgi:glyoxylase-like metal-dependent hydrolase (beta-lactamase superfamily II)
MHRRDLLTGASAAALVATAGPTAVSAQTAAQPPAPRFHAMQVGTLPVVVVSDGAVPRDMTQNVVPNATAEQITAALTAGGMPAPTIPNPFHQTVVRTRAGVVLFDTGFGQGAPAGLGQRPAAMRAAGIDPAGVAIVVFTHFHGDHIGGLIAPDGSPAFPNAAIKVPAQEWAFWTDEGAASRAPEAQRPGFEQVRRRFAPYEARVERFSAGAEVAPGVTAVPTPGHTPGHTSFLIADGGAQCLVIGDAVLTPALFMANPEWTPAFDMDRTRAVETRKALLDRAAAERLTVIGYHFPFPATGRVERAGTGYRLVPGGA